MKTDEMYDFMVRAVFEEIQRIKAELGEKRLGEKRKTELRRTLRLLCLALASLLELLPDQMSSDDVAKIIQRIPDVTCRRLKRVLMETVKVGKAQVGA